MSNSITTSNILDRKLTFTVLGTHWDEEKKANVPNGVHHSVKISTWHSIVAGCKKSIETDDKGSVSLFIPGGLTFEDMGEENGRRKSTVLNANISQIDFLVFDLEAAKPGASDLSVIQTIDYLKTKPWEFMIFQSHSHGLPEKGARGRLLVPLIEPIIPPDTAERSKWWRATYRNIAVVILGPFYKTWNAGIESADALRQAYYFRSHPVGRLEFAWEHYESTGVAFDASTCFAKDVGKNVHYVAAGVKAGQNISRKRLLVVVEDWWSSQQTHRAAKTLKAFLKGDVWAEDEERIPAMRDMCFYLARELGPFDPDLVVNEHFVASLAKKASQGGRSLSNRTSEMIHTLTTALKKTGPLTRDFQSAREAVKFLFRGL